MFATSSQSAADAPAPPRGFFSLELLDNRYPALHGLRVLAILSVVQFHVTWIFAGEQGIRLDGDFVASSLAVFFGMDLFFVLSGFLIGSILLHAIDKAGSQQVGRFYLRRIFRTFPSYYVVLTFLVLTTALTPGQRAHLPYEYLYATNFMPLGRPDIVMFWGWSLSLEEQFYLLVPLLMLILYKLRDDRMRAAFLVAFWAAALAVRMTIYLHHRPWSDLGLYGALYFHLQTRFDTLIAGILLALCHRRWKTQIGQWLRAPFHRALLAMPALACLWLLLFPTVLGAENVQLFHVFAWGTLTTLMYFAALTLLLHDRGPISRLLSAPLFRRLATLGYGVYLVHIPILDRCVVPAAHALQARRVPQVILWPFSFAVVMAGSLLIAWLLHLIIEKPALRLRDRIAG